MDVKTANRATGTTGRRDPLAVARALAHPLRVQILEVMNEGKMSASQFQRTVPDSPPLSNVSYHFRQLAEYGAIEVVEDIPRRGAVEHVYRAVNRASFTDQEWAGLAHEKRAPVTATVLGGLMARASGALTAGTFDSRLDRYLVWIGMKLDEQGWKEFMARLDATFADVEEVRAEAALRLAETGDKPIPATFGLMGFESPPAPETPAGD